MTKTYDAVIVGAGHNGLVCAAYLARAGREVLVLERREIVGGCAATEEFAPGFRCPATFPSVETFDPEITRELQLESHGLRLLAQGGVLVPRFDGEALYLPPPNGTGARAEGIPDSDAEALNEFDVFLRRLAAAFHSILSKPLPDLKPSGLGDLLEILGTGWPLRKLGARDLRETMRFLPMPIADVLDERFETDALKAAIGAGGITGSWLGPRSPGSALNLLLHRLGGCRGAVGYPRLAAGGSGALTEALRKAAEAAGATVRTDVEVTDITVVKGRATGVALGSGEEIQAAVVISNADPRTTLLDLVEPIHLDPSVVLAIRGIRSRGSVAIVKLALDRAPRFSGAPEDPAGRIQIGAHLDELEQAFDDTKYGRLGERPYLDIQIPSIADPSLAPDGKHVLSAWVQFPPYDLRDRGWEGAKDDLAAIVEKRIEDHAPGFSESILAREVASPVDLEERYGMTGGCLYHVEPALDQFLYLRPMPRWAGYQMPIEGLYLCGSGTHGGGGLTGLAGRNAARRVLATK
ncbi:MAG: NAD(P)/FAD-dependent oxidoreductase [bacterium]|nr:NAD(P)/FAD-dependent oxidoreductase [bacterium]